MTQVNRITQLPPVSHLDFKLEEDLFSKTNFHIPSFPQLNIPPFPSEDVSAKRFSTVDLGNPVMKKVKPNSELLPVRIPSFQLQNFAPSTLNPFPLSQTSLPLFIDLCQSPSFNLPTSGAIQKKNEKIGSSGQEASDGEEFDDFFSKIFDKKKALKRKDKISEKKESLPTKEKSFKQKYGFDLPSDSSFDFASFTGFPIPKFAEREPEEVKTQPQGQLQNALQNLQQRFLCPQNIQAETSISGSLQGELPQNVKAPSMKNLMTNFAENLLAEKIKSLQLRKTPLFDKTIFNETVFTGSDNNSKSTQFESNKSCSVTEISDEDEMSIDNLDQIYNSNLQVKKEELIKNAPENVKETPFNYSEESIQVKNRHNSFASTATSDKTEEKEKSLPSSPVVLEEIKEVKEPKKLKLRPTKSSNREEQGENDGADKVSKKIIQKKKTVRNIKNIKMRTRSTPVLISRWDLPSNRRKNRLQLTKTRRPNRMIQKSAKKVTKETKVISTKTVSIINLRPGDVHETHVGQKYQVNHPIPMPLKEPNPRRGPPKLMWNPKIIRKGILDFYFRKLCMLLDLDEVNEEKAIRMLREEENDVKKVLERIEGKKKEYAREFTIKQVRRT